VLLLQRLQQQSVSLQRRQKHPQWAVLKSLNLMCLAHQAVLLTTLVSAVAVNVKQLHVRWALVSPSLLRLLLHLLLKLRLLQLRQHRLNLHRHLLLQLRQLR
jgi:hypothetical protein